MVYNDSRVLISALDEGDVDRLYTIRRVKLQDLYPDQWHQTLVQFCPETAIIHVLQRCSGLNSRDDYGRSMLHHSIRFRRPFVTRWLLKRGVTHHVPDNDGWTPLRLAIRSGDLPTAEFLLSRTPDLNTTLSDGRSALHLALQYSRGSIVDTLLAAGVDTSLRDKLDQSAWYYALRYGTSETVDRLWKTQPPDDSELVETARQYAHPSIYLRLRNWLAS